MRTRSRALAHAGVGQADQRERGEAVRDVDLGEDEDGVETEQGGGADAGEHRSHRCKRRDIAGARTPCGPISRSGARAAQKPRRGRAGAGQGLPSLLA